MKPRDAARETIAALVDTGREKQEDPKVTAEKIIDALEGRSIAVFANPGFVEFIRASIEGEDD